MPCINVRFLEEELTGVGRFSTEVTKRLIKYFPDVVLISPQKIKVPQDWQVLKKGLFRGAVWEQFQLPFLLPKSDSWCFNPANTCALLAGNNITVVHDIIPLTNPEWYSAQARWYYKILLPLVIKRSKIIITVSEYNKAEINQLLHVPLNKIFVVHNAVDSFWQQDKTKPTHDNYLLTVASFDPRKNLKRLIEAFKLLEDKTLNLVIVGHKHKAFADSGILLSEEDKKRIHFTGYLSDTEVRNLYSNARAFVYPSLKEGFGIPPLEAMACGCPVIVAKTASLPEVCGDAAFYIDPSNVDSIAEGIKNVLSDARLQMDLISKGSLQVKKFSWDITAEKIAGILRSF